MPKTKTLAVKELIEGETRMCKPMSDSEKDVSLLRKKKPGLRSVPDILVIDVGFYEGDVSGQAMGIDILILIFPVGQALIFEYHWFI